jgi:RimJ/RimL family protein N-acetyltransferase
MLGERKTLEGERVRLRSFRDEDRDEFAAMNANPEVMAHFVAPLTRAESDAFLDRIEAGRAASGLGFMAVEDKATSLLAGMCGLAVVPWTASFTPAVEIGWRFVPAFQGQGLATEAARLVLSDGLDRRGLQKIVAFTVQANTPSWRLMERIGMTRAGTFEHPRIPEGHPLRLQLLYETGRATDVG